MFRIILPFKRKAVNWPRSFLSSDRQQVEAELESKQKLAEKQNIEEKRPENTELKMPEEPTNCCGSGCNFCVWLTYWEDLMEYQSKVNSSSSSSSPPKIE